LASTQITAFGTGSRWCPPVTFSVRVSYHDRLLKSSRRIFLREHAGVAMVCDERSGEGGCQGGGRVSAASEMMRAMRSRQAATGYSSRHEGTRPVPADTASCPGSIPHPSRRYPGYPASFALCPPDRPCAPKCSRYRGCRNTSCLPSLPVRCPRYAPDAACDSLKNKNKKYEKTY